MSNPLANGSVYSDDSDDSGNSSGLTWLVLVNDENQHALWPVLRPVPEGWREVGPEGSKPDCLAWIDSHWTDMRPKSLQ